MSLKSKIVDLFSRKAKAAEGGGEKAIQKQVSLGKMTARERIRNKAVNLGIVGIVAIRMPACRIPQG